MPAGRPAGARADPRRRARRVRRCLRQHRDQERSGRTRLRRVRVASPTVWSPCSRRAPSRSPTGSSRRSASRASTACRQLAPELPTAWLTFRPVTSDDIDDVVAARPRGASIPRFRPSTATLIARCHERGLAVNTWTCNDPSACPPARRAGASTASAPTSPTRSSPPSATPSPPRAPKISTSIFERLRTISRPRIASTALAEVLGHEIERRALDFACGNHPPGRTRRTARGRGRTPGGRTRRGSRRRPGRGTGCRARSRARRGRPARRGAGSASRHPRRSAPATPPSSARGPQRSERDRHQTAVEGGGAGQVERPVAEIRVRVGVEHDGEVPVGHDAVRRDDRKCGVRRS